MNSGFNEIDFTNQIDSLSEGAAVRFVYQKLDQLGRLCWVSGGAVRDLVLGRIPEDVDLVTDALDSEILDLFPQAILVGQKFGVYKIPFVLPDTERNIIIDLTVFRKEDQYIDGRRPISIERSNPEEDAKRRDFSINALFYDLKNKKIIDYVNGLQDLHAKTLKCVGDPSVRFNEDHLRLLRLARFQAQLSYQVDPVAQKAALDKASLISTISGERIYDEVFKVMKSQSESAFWNLDLTQKLFGYLGFDYELLRVKTLEVLKQLPELSIQEMLIFNFVILGEYQESILDFLKNKLKISNREFHFAKKIIKTYQEVTKKTKSVFVLALDLDKEKKSQDLHHIYRYLLKCGMIADQDMIKILDFQNYPALISGADLVGLCDPHETSEKLDQVRILQFQGVITNKEQALRFVTK